MCQPSDSRKGTPVTSGLKNTCATICCVFAGVLLRRSSLNTGLCIKIARFFEGVWAYAFSTCALAHGPDGGPPSGGPPSGGPPSGGPPSGGPSGGPPSGGPPPGGPPSGGPPPGGPAILVVLRLVVHHLVVLRLGVRRLVVLRLVVPPSGGPPSGGPPSGGPPSGGPPPDGPPPDGPVHNTLQKTKNNQGSHSHKFQLARSTHQSFQSSSQNCPGGGPDGGAVPPGLSLRPAAH